MYANASDSHHSAAPAAPRRLRSRRASHSPRPACTDCPGDVWQQMWARRCRGKHGRHRPAVPLADGKGHRIREGAALARHLEHAPPERRSRPRHVETDDYLIRAQATSDTGPERSSRSARTAGPSDRKSAPWRRGPSGNPASRRLDRPTPRSRRSCHDVRIARYEIFEATLCSKPVERIGK